jgi:3-hydroxyacyl-[acyl-carrier-protein] dehydratase
LEKPENKNKLAFFMGIDKVKFRKPVVPGDQLELKVEILRPGRVGKAKGEAYVGGVLVTEAEFMFAIVDMLGFQERAEKGMKLRVPLMKAEVGDRKHKAALA